MEWDVDFDERPSKAYKTIRDVVEHEVMPALGDFAGDYDATAIARDCWRYDEAAGGFVKAVDDDGFWSSAIEHDVSRL